MRVLVACEFSGVVRRAFRALGHDAYSCDLLPAEDESMFHIQGDAVRTAYMLPWDLMIAHPPCTYLTLAGNKWMKPEFAERFPTRPYDRQLAIDFFLALARVPIARTCIENPVSIMSTQYRKPDQIIPPYHFGLPIRKTTCLWLNGLLPLRYTEIVEPALDRFPSGNTQSKWHTETGHIKCRHERSKVRSKTFPEIAQAMALQWGGDIRKANAACHTPHVHETHRRSRMKPQPQTFLGTRGETQVNLTFRDLYLIVRERLEYVDGSFDPDAVCQNVCVEIEKKMGIYPNLSTHPLPMTLTKRHYTGMEEG
jgi:hypothetical protein